MDRHRFGPFLECGALSPLCPAAAWRRQLFLKTHAPTNLLKYLAMALPERTRKLVQRLLEAFCEERVPAHVRDRIILSFAFTGNRVTLYEERAILLSPPKSSQSQQFDPTDLQPIVLEERHKTTTQINVESSGSSLRPTDQSPHETRAWVKTPIAQFRFDPKSKEWQLYCMHRDERWHKYFGTVPTPSFMSLLSEVDADPTCIFWG